MSGKDERKSFKVPQCSNCGKRSDIEIRYPNGNVAGWILSEEERIKFDAVVLVNESFHLNLNGIKANCNVCGYLNVDIANKAVKFFKKDVQAGKYITWFAWMEMDD